MPFGVLADRVRRTLTLGIAIVLWALAMFWSAAVANFHQLLEARLMLGAVTAAAGPLVASLIGDYFPASERGRIYSFVLAGELLGTGFGFAVTGDIATLSWRASFVVLALPALALAWLVVRLPEPARGASAVLIAERSPAGGDARNDEREEPDARGLAREYGIDPTRSSLCRATASVSA